MITILLITLLIFGAAMTLLLLLLCVATVQEWKNLSEPKQNMIFVYGFLAFLSGSTSCAIIAGLINQAK